MSSDSIKLHPEHGLNPTVVMCFWCGKERGEVALLGASYKGRAPMHMVLDYNPCAQCEEDMKKGLLVIETTDTPTRSPKQPPLPSSVGTTAYPTGRWCVVEPDALLSCLNIDDERKAHVKSHGKIFLDAPAYKEIFGFLDEKTDADVKLAMSEVGGHA